MTEAINEKVSVVALYDHVTKRFIPKRIKWKERIYQITEICMHQLMKRQGILHHFFSVTDGNQVFHLALNTEDLSWILLQTSDGL